MDASTEYCDFCDLPMSQCVHGMPSPPKDPPKAPPTAPRKTPTQARKRVTTTATTKPVTRRWTPPEVFKPLIVTVLERAGGGLEAEDALLQLEVLAADRLLPGDSETTPQGELRWRYAARRARAALVEDGVMTKDRPGIWTLADQSAGPR